MSWQAPEPEESKSFITRSLARNKQLIVQRENNPHLTDADWHSNDERSMNRQSRDEAFLGRTQALIAADSKYDAWTPAEAVALFTFTGALAVILFSRKVAMMKRSRNPYFQANQPRLAPRMFRFFRRYQYLRQRGIKSPFAKAFSAPD